MIILIPISIAVFLLGLGGGIAIWLVFWHRQAVKSREPSKQATTVETLTFRWSYIILPIAILLLSIILSGYFYHLLPSEVAYHFRVDGSPDKWLSRGMIIVWALAPQLFLTLLAGAIAWGMTKLGGLFGQPESARIKPERILLLMGNMIGLPQIILGFAMLDIFSYNSYQIRIMPMWLFLLIILGLVTIALGVFLIFIISRQGINLFSRQRTKED